MEQTLAYWFNSLHVLFGFFSPAPPFKFYMQGEATSSLSSCRGHGSEVMHGVGRKSTRGSFNRKYSENIW
ncbi:hypothetical protein CsSME_00030146 [Camellia sinensis var. sinensis]